MSFFRQPVISIYCIKVSSQRLVIHHNKVSQSDMPQSKAIIFKGESTGALSVSGESHSGEHYKDFLTVFFSTTMNMTPKTLASTMHVRTWTGGRNYCRYNFEARKKNCLHLWTLLVIRPSVIPLGRVHGRIYQIKQVWLS